MRLLVVGGAGYVASLVVPLLAPRHDIHIFDRQPPADAQLAHTVAQVTDHQALCVALRETDAVIFLAMGDKRFELVEAAHSNLEVAVVGLHLVLDAMQRSGVPHLVYASTMSVYGGDLLARRFGDESLPPDSDHVYGLAKRLGEAVCQSAVRRWGLSVNALRLCFPLDDAAWQREAAATDGPILATAASDLARLLEAALRHRDGFQAFTTSGDYAERIMVMSKARQQLGWAPLARPGGTDADAV